ncbi:antitoxin PaaA2 family protein [Xanthomonas fragariae]|uniref:antitoxin PaaA2 family protein n=1 Tax=Xanthomonas fragariae TaxID=48664 RepID=UPI001ABE95B8|nr:hypothetical protein [Xanthomonas fragariae]UKR53117.1 hypothetical protein K4A87_03470 [Xanthomonas fragariae]
MQSMTIEQLRVAKASGGVAGVTLKGEGGAFFVQIATRNGPAAVLAKARSTEPRKFGNPAAALHVLLDIGITVGAFDASAWNPDAKLETAGTRGRSEAMRKAHEAAAYTHWLALEIGDAIKDPRPNLSHDEVMAEMDADISALEAEHKPARRKRA